MYWKMDPSSGMRDERTHHERISHNRIDEEPDTEYTGESDEELL